MESIDVQRGEGVDDVVLGVVWARGCRVAPSPPPLGREIDDAVARAASREDVEEARSRVRGMLRFGKYKPTGRGKPASEYLLQAAREDRFPRINSLVDINNLVSLETLLPISVVDLGRAGARRFLLRRGREGESYVFNSAGQGIELRDLLLVATLPDDRPCANAVKDSMATKVADDTTDVAAFIYAPAGLEAEARRATDRFADALVRWSGASEADVALYSRSGSSSGAS